MPEVAQAWSVSTGWMAAWTRLPRFLMMTAITHHEFSSPDLG
jgi:hypothetical protein